VGRPDALVDTDVFVDHVRGAHRLREGRATVRYSVITRAELFAGRTSEPLLRDLLDRYDEVGVDRSTAEVGGWIRRAFGLALPDALIAATALVHDLDLVSRNLRHFERVPGLRLRDSL
jgi:predicted nucleic acid-binding protein